MGFCGCSNHASVVTAAVFGIVFSIYGIAWTSSAISLLTQSYLNTPFYNSFFVFSNIQYIKTDAGILGLIIFTLVLHLVWLLSSILLAVGNESKRLSYLYMWIPVSSIILLADVGCSIYCVMKAVGSCGSIYINGLDVNSECRISYFVYLLLAVLFEKGGLITIGIQIALTICVSNRAREIKEERMRPQQVAVLSPTVGYTMPVQNYVIGPTFQQPNYQPVNYGYAQGWNEPAPPYTTSVANAHQHIPYAKLSGRETSAPPRNLPYREFHSQDDLSTGPRY